MSTVGQDTEFFPKARSTRHFGIFGFFFPQELAKDKFLQNSTKEKQEEECNTKCGVGSNICH